MKDLKIGGKSIPKPALYASGAVAVGILGYAYWIRRNSSADTTDPNAIDPSIDPSTGLPYADEFGGGMGGFTGSGNNVDPTTGVTTQTNTNAAWSQAAQAYLTGIGYDPAIVGTALGKAFSGSYMTADEVAIWNAATAFEGYPPQGYAGINTTPPSGQGNNNGGGDSGGNGNGGNNGGTTPATPKVTGKGPVTGLKVLSKSQTTISLDWNPVSGAKGYHVDKDGHRQVTVTYSQAHIYQLKANTKYYITITPVMSNGNSGSPKSITVTTPKAPAKKAVKK